MMKILCYVIVGFIILSSCKNPGKKQSANETVKRAKFEPEDGKCLFFIGQDLDAIGGLENYKEGYVDHFDVPAGVTAYTNFRIGDESFGHTYRGLDGLTTTDNWGSGDCNMKLMMEEPKFKYCTLAIGLELVNHEGATARGERDSMIVTLGKWIKNLGKRPVFLRIGYEFDGHSWNHYNRKEYLLAFKRIHNMFDSLQVNNVAYVWQSAGTQSNQEQLENWYPGDKYVDWCAYSYFAHPDTEMITFARKHEKPVFIAELTPVFKDTITNVHNDTDIKKPEIAQQIWEQWFAGFFKTMDENKDVIKAFSYINTDWPSESMWVNNNAFNQVDSRIQMSEYISSRWTAEMAKERYLKPNEDLFGTLSESNQVVNYEDLKKKAIAQPLVEHIYTADPSAHVFNGKIYVYPSHDIEAGIAFNDNGCHFDMRDYHVLSMDEPGDKVTDHGVALDVKDVPWAGRQMWAPDVACKNGKYYLYFPLKDKNDIFRIGVAVSDSPTGPFKAEEQPIEGSFTIDPAVFEDSDGSYYMYFGGIWGGQLQKYRNNTYSADNEEPSANEPALGPIVVKMSEDMLGFAEEPKEIQILDKEGKPLLAGDNDRRFFEASWMHKYNGKYYFSYSTGDTHLICYATSDNPYGPFTYQGVILKPVVGWTTHHSICEFKGKWYLFYHDSVLSKGVTHLRSVKCTELKYDKNGYINTIEPYLE